ncbi:hypothetical protein YGAWVPHU_CDS0036 [Salmonella phage SeKF_13]
MRFRRVIEDCLIWFPVGFPLLGKEWNGLEDCLEESL